MKLCPACSHRFAQKEWLCPACGAEPQTLGGFYAFAPDLSGAEAGFFPEDHGTLDRLQGKSFWFRARNKLIQALIAAHCPKTRSALEVGCGTGFVLSGLRQVLPNAVLWGSELDVSALAYAQKRVGAEVQLLQMDARRIPFEDEFDLIAACDVLEHIDDDRGVLRQMYAALTSGGWLLLTVPQHPLLWSEADTHACHKRRYARTELSDKVKAEGFDIIVDTSFVFFLLPLMVLRRVKDLLKLARDPTRELSLPSKIDGFFEAVLQQEARWILRGHSFPFGGSRVILAKKSSKEAAP